MLKRSLHRAPEGAACTKNPSDDTPKSTRYDGTYEMRIVWPKVPGADARCVGGLEAGPKGAIYDLVLDKGVLRLWIRVGGPNAERELGDESHYRFFRDQFETTASDGSKGVMDFTYEAGALKFSDTRHGADCGGRAIFTTKPWIRQ